MLSKWRRPSYHIIKEDDKLKQDKWERILDLGTLPCKFRQNALFLAEHREERQREEGKKGQAKEKSRKSEKQPEGLWQRSKGKTMEERESFRQSVLKQLGIHMPKKKKQKRN